MRKKVYLLAFTVALTLTVTQNSRAQEKESLSSTGDGDESVVVYTSQKLEKKKKLTPEQLLQSLLPNSKVVLDKVNEQCKTYVPGGGYEDAKAITSAWINTWNNNLGKLQSPPKWKMRVVERSEPARDWGGHDDYIYYEAELDPNQ